MLLMVNSASAAFAQDDALGRRRADKLARCERLALEQEQDEDADIRAKVRSLEKQVAALEHELNTDSKTGARSPRWLEKALPKDINELGDNFAMIVLDLDFFRAVNATFGHGGADVGLKRTVEVIQSVLREGDEIARWGGDEFVVVLANVAPEHAMDIAGKVLGRMRESKVLKDLKKLEVNSGSDFYQFDYITASVGMTMVRRTKAHLTLAEAQGLLHRAKERADIMSIRSKGNADGRPGRNKLTAADEPVTD